MANHIDPEMWKDWEKTGKSKFLKLCIPLLRNKTTDPVFVKNNETELIDHITLLIYNGTHGTIKKEFVIGALQELIALNSGIVPIICDALNIADANTSVCDSYKKSPERHNFGYVVQQCRKLIPERLLQERLEIDTLQEFGILKNCNFSRKFIKLKTKLYYKQQKFNLLAEENEGYAKLLTELNQNFDDSVPSKTLLDNIQSLVGCFRLDPNKVLVVILESFEQKLKNENIFVPLIRSFMNDKRVIAEILGYEYLFYKSNSSGLVPKTLYLLTAQLLHHELVLLDDVYEYLQPEDQEICKEWKSDIMKANEEFKKIDGTTVTLRQEDENKGAENFPKEHYLVNQKIYLCETLLNLGDWKNAKKILDRLSPQVGLSHEPVALALCKLLHHIIEPVYRENCNFGNKNMESTFDNNHLVIKQSVTFLDLRDDAISMIITLGPSLRFDPLLMCKITRLARAALNSYGIDSSKCAPPNEDSIYWDILNLLEAAILPALSFMDCNSCMAEEIWNVLKLYPYQTRYCLYGRWKKETYFSYPDLLRKRCHYVKTIKTLMKNVTKGNVKRVGRQIAKLTNCSPTIILDYVLIQIQMFESIIIPIVQSLKYLTGLSYDVLAFSLIETLSNTDEQHAHNDGTSISSWLKSLGIFCATIFKRYDIELTGILQYLANQLKSKRSEDLIILSEIVRMMTGIEVNENMTVSQLNALAGGKLLKAEVAYFSQKLYYVKESSMRLQNSMSEQNLGVALCLLTAQQIYYLTYKEKGNNLKFVGSLIDRCQGTMLQLGTFLGSTLSNEEFFNNLPSIRNMLNEYHIPKEVAFLLARPKLNHFINNKFKELNNSNPNFANLPIKTKYMMYMEAVNEVMEPINNSIIFLYSGSTWQHLSPKLFVTFWSLSLSDIFVPNATYQEIIDQAKQKRKAILDSPDDKNKKEFERTTVLIEKLSDEKERQNEHKEKVTFRLNVEKNNWFLNGAANSNGTHRITEFLKLCLFPRCTFSQIDAIYCAKFIYTTHMLKTPNFPTLLCYDKLFSDITFFIRSSTENEAMRYGRFLCDILETTLRWHRSKIVFENECAGYPGFVTKYRISNQSQETLDHVNYENYRHLCCKWQKLKLIVAITNCLNSKEFVQIRNSLIVLIKILPYFPLLFVTSQTIVSKIEDLIMEEKHNRPDLELLAIAYLGQLRQKISSGCMVKEGEFHEIMKKSYSSERNNTSEENEDDDVIKGYQKSEDSVSVATISSEIEEKLKYTKIDENARKSDVNDEIEKLVNSEKIRNKRKHSYSRKKQNYRTDHYNVLANYKNDAESHHRGNSSRHFEERQYDKYAQNHYSRNNDNRFNLKRTYNSTESEDPNKKRKN